MRLARRCLMALGFGRGRHCCHGCDGPARTRRTWHSLLLERVQSLAPRTWLDRCTLSPMGEKVYGVSYQIRVPRRPPPELSARHSNADAVSAECVCLTSKDTLSRVSSTGYRVLA
jgi:hypothetical protein